MLYSEVLNIIITHIFIYVLYFYICVVVFRGPQKSVLTDKKSPRTLGQDSLN